MAEQPLPSVTVTEYEPDALTVTDCVVAPLFHSHDKPAEAVNVTEPPAQNVVGPPAVMFAAGKVFTVTNDVVLLHPLPFVKVNVALPAETPVTTPALVTVATAVLLLVHVPPVVGDKVMVLPTQTAAGAVTTGKAFTVTDDVVLLQFVVVFVKVNVALPAETPVTTPALVTVAMAVLLLVHVPSVVGDKVIVLPTQTAAGAVTTGKAFTVTDDVVLLHPLPSVKVNVALPAETPVTTPALVTVAMAVLLLVHVPPVVGDKVIVLPTQTAAGAVTTGKAFTANVCVALDWLHGPVAGSKNARK